MLGLKVMRSTRTPPTRIVLGLWTGEISFWPIYGPLKGTYRDHRVTGALNFYKIRDFCILVMQMVLDV